MTRRAPWQDVWDWVRRQWTGHAVPDDMPPELVAAEREAGEIEERILALLAERDVTRKGQA